MFLSAPRESLRCLIEQLPADELLTQLPSLQILNLSFTSLGGTVPEQLGHAPALSQLDFYDMRLLHELPTSVLHKCKPFGPATCQGLPPLSCSAFGPRARLSLSSLGKCVECPAERAWTVVQLGLAAVLVPAAVGLYIWAVARYPHFKMWIATSSLVTSHLQVIAPAPSLSAADTETHSSSAYALAAAALSAPVPACAPSG